MVSSCYLCKYSLILQSNTITYDNKYKLPKIIFTYGITVPNIKEAVKFIWSNGLVHYYGTLYSKERKKKRLLVYWRFGEDWKEFEIAHLATSDGIGIELFSSLTESKKLQNSILSHGLFFFCVQDPLKTSSKNCILRW
jgi:hypothetical protein